MPLRIVPGQEGNFLGLIVYSIFQFKCSREQTIARDFPLPLGSETKTSFPTLVLEKKNADGTWPRSAQRYVKKWSVVHPSKIINLPAIICVI
ncbi:hypothetical protein EMCRGX_G027334 [Ephydatia muelleri]